MDVAVSVVDASRPPELVRHARGTVMLIRIGFDIVYDCPQPTPMILLLNSHFSRAADIVVPDRLATDPAVPITPYRDGFGNWCSRIVAPQGRIRLSTEAVLRDDGRPNTVDPTVR